MKIEDNLNCFQQISWLNPMLSNIYAYNISVVNTKFISLFVIMLTLGPGLIYIFGGFNLHYNIHIVKFLAENKFYIWRRITIV